MNQLLHFITQSIVRYDELQSWQFAQTHGKCRRKSRGKLLFYCFRQNFAYAKYFFTIGNDKVDLDIYFYFLTLHIHNQIDGSFESMIFVPFSGIFFLSIQIQFTAIFERSDSQELSLETKKHYRCFLVNSLVLGGWFYIRFRCTFIYSEFLISTAHYTDPETNTRKCYLNGKHIGYPNG